MHGYFALSGLTYSTDAGLGTLGTNYYETQQGYDKRGLPTRSVSPTGTITRTVNDGLGRPVSVWIGIDDTPETGFWSPTNPADMVKVREYIIDDAEAGDGNVTAMIEYPGGGADERRSDFYVDWRNRRVISKEGVQETEDTGTNRPLTYLEYDNLGQVVATERYDGDDVTPEDTNDDGVPDKPSSSLLRARSTSAFDARSRQYRTQVFSVDPSSGSVSTNALTTDIWFNRRGRVIKQAQPGGLVSKLQYDGAGRVIKGYTTDGGGDSGWSDADDVTDDAVLEQVETQYGASGNAILVTTRERFHDETTTGALADASTAPKARVSYMASYYDAANRLTDSVNVGTNGGSSWTRPGTVPSRSDTVLVVSQAYNAAGWVESVTDARGIVGKKFYDNLGRITKTIEAYVDGTPSDADDKTTEFSYDGSGNMLTLKALLSGSAYQTTQWIYGVTTAGGSGVDSNDLLAAMRYPDKSSGDPSSSEQESYTVNALGEGKTTTDRNGNVHTYSRDVLGRLTSDAVTTLGSGVDGAVRRIDIAYDSAGYPYLYTSYDAASSGDVINEVQRVYNGLGQLVTEYQEHSGAVNTSTTLKVEYAYSEMASAANHSRLVTMTYPNGRVLNYNYASGVDSSISRLSSLSDSSATLESYSYLGLDTIIRRAHAEPGIDLTYIKQSGESIGDAGDQYAGLDRFGRVVDQRWIKTSDGSHTDRFKYGYDRGSNRLYRENAVDAAFSELYHANGASAGYDLLNQLSDFRRGTLSDSNSDNVPDTVSTASRSQEWEFDALGNWSDVTTDSSSQTRGHNLQNQITSISGQASPAFDANGNMTGDETGNTLVFDAWNRLVEVNDGSTTLASYAVDGLNRRISEDSGTATDLYYSDTWQVLEEREASLVRSQNVWSQAYIDALVLRDRDVDGDGSVMEERLYVQQDANWNATALVEWLSPSNTWQVAERYVYDPYGRVLVLDSSWSSLSGSSYGWAYLHQGGRYDSASGLFHFRFRDYSSVLGRFVSQDPIGFQAGDVNTYRFIRNSPANSIDPHGLDFWEWLAEDVIGLDTVLGWDTYLGDRANGWFQDVNNGATGYGDGLTLGATYSLRTLSGCQDVVDSTSAAHRWGRVAGATHLMLIIRFRSRGGGGGPNRGLGDTWPNGGPLEDTLIIVR